MSAVVTRTPAGRPSSTATRAGPCDSPAVSQRTMPPLCRSVALPGGVGHANRPCPRERTGPVRWCEVLVDDDAAGRARCDVDRRAVTELDRGLAVLHRQQREVLGED